MSLQKQRIIMQAARNNDGVITLNEAIDLPGINTYYCNASKYVGEIFTRMVKRGMMERVKPGHFKINERKNITGSHGSTQQVGRSLWDD